MTTNIVNEPRIARDSSNTEEQVMCVHEKLALGYLLREWQSCFDGRWVTAEQAIHHLRHSYEHDTPYHFGIKSGDGDELNRRLDELRNRVIYDFVVKRVAPYMQPVKWCVLLRDNGVKFSDEERSDFLAVRKEEGLNIDPATARVFWHWGQVLDPYGIYELGPEEDCVGRQYFARSPGSDIWVSFYDLPDATRDALEERRS